MYHNRNLGIVTIVDRKVAISIVLAIAYSQSQVFKLTDFLFKLLSLGTKKLNGIKMYRFLHSMLFSKFSWTLTMFWYFSIRAIHNWYTYIQKIKSECYHIHNFFLNSFLASGDFCRLLIAFANSLDPDQDLNSVQKLCGTGFSQFLLLYVVIGPTSLWESYSWRPPLISPAGSLTVCASGKALVSWEKSENSEMRPQTKSSWRWLPHKIHQYSSICFTSLESIFKLLKCNTPFTWILNVLITRFNKNDSLYHKVLLVLVHVKVKIRGLGDLQWWQLVISSEELVKQTHVINPRWCADIFNSACMWQAQRKEFLAIRWAISLNETFVLFCWNDDWRN